MKKKILKKPLEGRITISRVTSSHDGEFIEIRLEDSRSSTDFVTVKMSMESFAQAVTGHGYIPMTFDPRGLDRIGKVMEHKELIFPVKERYGCKEEAEKNCQKFCDPGWEADCYFSSQNSFFDGEDGKHYARGIQRRYVEVKEE